jgi:hypothetical protein
MKINYFELEVFKLFLRRKEEENNNNLKGTFKTIYKYI